jgi:hypothetical protein
MRYWCGARAIGRSYHTTHARTARNQSTYRRLSVSSEWMELERLVIWNSNEYNFFHLYHFANFLLILVLFVRVPRINSVRRFTCLPYGHGPSAARVTTMITAWIRELWREFLNTFYPRFGKAGRTNLLSHNQMRKQLIGLSCDVAPKEH